MYELIGLIGVTAAVALFIGLISPRWVRQPSRPRAALVFGGTFLLALVLMPEPSPEAQTRRADAAAARAQRDSISGVERAARDSVAAVERAVRDSVTAARRRAEEERKVQAQRESEVRLAGFTLQSLCADRIKNQLRAPATAKFGGWERRAGDSLLVVTGHVDAQNSFGALLRNRVRCVGVIRGERVAIREARLLD